MSTFIAAILLVMLIGDLLWWRWMRGLARTSAMPRWARRTLDAFAIIALASLLFVIATRVIDRRLVEHLPTAVFSATLLWHLLGLPISLTVALLRRGGEIVRDRAALPAPTDSVPDEAPPPISRRAFLGRTAAVAPIVVVGTSLLRSQQTVNDFRIRAMDLPIRNLPAGLDGLSIAHVTDTHLGRLTDRAVFERIVRATNDLDVDLVLHTGDLINDDQRDLPAAAEFVRTFRSRYGTFLCEGNHDLIGGRESFEQFMRDAQMPILIDETRTLRINNVDVDLLGIAWARVPRSENPDKAIGRSVDALSARRTPGAFGILLAHHPHALDAAARNGIPLTLAGHTHGGQINLTHNIGFGAMMYRYWSGPYQVGDATGFVSNGAGNWFPLRMNTPAEIVRLTLRRA